MPIITITIIINSASSLDANITATVITAAAQTNKSMKYYQAKKTREQKSFT